VSLPRDPDATLRSGETAPRRAYSAEAAASAAKAGSTSRLRLCELIEAQQHLRQRLLEISRLSERQCHIPADRADALLALLDRKQGLLRELCAIDAPTLFRDCAGLAAANGDDDAQLEQAKARLHREAEINLELWKQIVESEERARNHCATCVQQLSVELSNAHRKSALRRAYAEPCAHGPATPRFVNHLR